MSARPCLSAAELSVKLGGRLLGDGSRKVSEVSTLEAAGPESLSWVGRPDHFKRLAGSRAGVVLVPRECADAVPAGRTAIVVDDPDVAICALLEMLAPPRSCVPPGVDPTARVAADAVVTDVAIGPHVFVGAGATIGPGTQLHAGVYVGAGCRLGRDCVLWPNVVLREHTTLGDRVVIHPNATLGADGFGYLQRGGRHVKIPQVGRVVIGDDVEIGANTCIDRARSGVTRVGRGTKIDNLVQIGHNVQIGEDCIIVAEVGISGSAVIGNRVMLGGQVGIADHVKLGDGAMVTACSMVATDVPPGRVYRGTGRAVEHTEFARQAVALRRLPGLLAQFRALSRRVERLESATDH